MSGHYVISADLVDNWPSGCKESEKDIIIFRAESIVERISKDFFYPKNFTMYLNGNGKSKLYIPIRQKVLSVNQLSINRIPKSTVDLTGSNIEGTKGDYTVTLTMQASVNGYADCYIGICDYSETIDKYWGCRIISNTATDGNGKSVFTLSEALPVTLDSNDIVSVITKWRYDEDSVMKPLESNTVEVESLQSDKNFFLKGYNNIEVTGTCGYYECPQPVKEASIILAQYENEPERYETYAFKSENLQGAYSYNRGEEKMMSGIIEADRLLRNYLNKRPLCLA